MTTMPGIPTPTRHRQPPAALLATLLTTTLAATLATPAPALAGNLDNAAPPANGSGMPSLSGLYLQLSTGTPATVPGAFQEPTAGPNGGTGRSLTDLLTLLPVADNVNGAQSAQVLAGKTFWGLSNGPAGQWGLRTGTMPLGSNVTGSNGALSFTLPLGFYDGNKTATAADSNLVAGNIQSGTTIFGVTGTATLATGSATAAQVLSGATFSNSSGNNLTGTMPMGSNVTGSNGALSFTLPLGFYDGNKTATAADSNLVAGNIQSGTTIFGVTGTATLATGSATAAQVLSGATFSNSSANGLTGTMANQGAPTFTPGTASQNLSPGYYSGGTVQGDSNLVAGNIKSGASIFGISGASTVVDTAGTNAAAGDIASGKTAYVNGALLTGTATSTPTVPGNYYPVVTTVAGLCTQGWGGTNCTTPCAGGLTGKSCDVLISPTQNITPNYASSPWNCVYDSQTGLMWEVQTAGSGFRGADERFSWYDSNPATNGGNVGAAGGTSCANAGNCDTQDFVANVNAAALCGYSDWRMPTTTELSGVASVSGSFFPNQSASTLFWSSESVAGNSFNAWALIINPSIQSMSFGKGSALSVQLVRPVK